MASVCSLWSWLERGHCGFRPLADKSRGALVYGAHPGDRVEIAVGRTGQDLPPTLGVGLGGVVEAVGTRLDQVDSDRSVALAGGPLGEDLAVECVVLLERHAGADLDAACRQSDAGGQRDKHEPDDEKYRGISNLQRHDLDSFAKGAPGDKPGAPAWSRWSSDALRSSGSCHPCIPGWRGYGRRTCLLSPCCPPTTRRRHPAAPRYRRRSRGRSRGSARCPSACRP